MNSCTGKKPSLLWLAALGVVFGDIGTSPLYAFQTAVSFTGAGHAVGVASLMIWTVILVVSVKYATILMRQDYKGQGGVFALFALFKKSQKGKPVAFGIMLTVAFGASLLLGDGTLTPAISVLSAVEGIETIHPELQQIAPVIAVAILILLFAVQRFGTGRLGVIFGPVMLLWFLAIGAMGLVQIIIHPSVLVALNPIKGIALLASSGWHGLVIMGAVALAVTGAEALYADLANFGKGAILGAWYGVALPALLLNYLGQASFVELHQSDTSQSGLFFLLCPMFLRAPLILLATVATVIASQALITAVFTLCRQAKSLDLLPPLMTRHTNSKVREQIYIPTMNFILGLACVLLVAFFKSTASLANAYGVAVTGAMVVTSILWGTVIFSCTEESRWKNALILCGLLTLDMVLFLSCMTKFFLGGYIPFCFALAVMILMFTWNRGRKLIGDAIRGCPSPEELGKRLAVQTIPRVPCTRVYITREKSHEHAVYSIIEFQRSTGSTADTVVILMIPSTWSNPNHAIGDPIIRRHEGGLWEITVPHGYMVDADVPASLMAAANASEGSFRFDPENTYYIYPKELPSPNVKFPMPSWQRRIYSFIVRNIVLPDALKIPADKLLVYFSYISAK